jgi:quinol-cytochrome oxidoreductase complex cytochrome b subunit
MIFLSLFGNDLGLYPLDSLLAPVVQVISNLMLLILLAFIVEFLRSKKNTQRYNSPAFFIWIFIVLLIVLALFAVFSLLNGSAFTELQNAAIIISGLVFSIFMYLPQILLLIILQQSNNKEFYDAFIKENPSKFIRKTKMHASIL